MATIVSGNRETMVSEMYGSISERVADYIQERIDTMRERYGDAGKRYVDKVQSLFNRTARASIAAAKNVLRSSKSLLSDGFTRMDTVSEFLQATKLDREYITSNPYFSREISRGRLDGWSDVRVDRFPSNLGKYNPLYQQAVSGLYQYSDEDFTGTVTEDGFVFYFEHEEDELREITEKEQIIIRNNWIALYNLTQESEDEDGEPVRDPTSLSGNYL